MDTETSSKISVDLIFSPVVNFAMQQNHVPVIKRLILINKSEENLSDLNVKISFDPDFAVTWKGSLDVLDAKKSHTFGAVPISMSANFLAELTERLSGRLFWR